MISSAAAAYRPLCQYAMPGSNAHFTISFKGGGNEPTGACSAKLKALSAVDCTTLPEPPMSTESRYRCHDRPARTKSTSRRTIVYNRHAPVANAGYQFQIVAPHLTTSVQQYLT
jgi:hypothetical protein